MKVTTETRDDLRKMLRNTKTKVIALTVTGGAS
jgi:hypothetical protein